MRGKNIRQMYSQFFSPDAKAKEKKSLPLFLPPPINFDGSMAGNSSFTGAAGIIQENTESSIISFSSPAGPTLLTNGRDGSFAFDKWRQEKLRACLASFHYVPNSVSRLDCAQIESYQDWALQNLFGNKESTIIPLRIGCAVIVW